MKSNPQRLVGLSVKSHSDCISVCVTADGMSSNVAISSYSTLTMQLLSQSTKCDSKQSSLPIISKLIESVPLFGFRTVQTHTHTQNDNHKMPKTEE